MRQSTYLPKVHRPASSEAEMSGDLGSGVFAGEEAKGFGGVMSNIVKSSSAVPQLSQPP